MRQYAGLTPKERRFLQCDAFVLEGNVDQRYEAEGGKDALSAAGLDEADEGFDLWSFGFRIGVEEEGAGVGVEAFEDGAAVDPRHRVCGEFISGVDGGTLEALGIADCLDAATSLQSASWSDSGGRLAEMRVPGRGISRWKLDDLLQGRFLSLGGSLVTNSRIASVPGVVWAAGRPRRPSPWLGLKCHARNLSLSHDLEMFSSSVPVGVSPAFCSILYALLRLFFGSDWFWSRGCEGG